MFKLGSFEKELMTSMETKLAENQIENQYQFNKVAKAIDYLNKAADIFDQSGLKIEAEELTNILVSLSKKWEDKIHGGLADKRSPKDFNRVELRRGIKVEREHTNNIQIAMEIAMDHLTEDPNYYKKLEKMEQE